MRAGMKSWGVRFASITVLGLGLVAGSAGAFGMGQAEAASPEQYHCWDSIRYERSAFDYPEPSTAGAPAEGTNRAQVLGSTLTLCGNFTICDEFSDSVRQFHVPMAIWNGAEKCASSGEVGLPLL